MNGLEHIQNAISWGNTLRMALVKSKYVSYLLILSILVATGFGLLLFLLDPNIKSFYDGVWVAWVTMTHVGFGDIVPVSFIGRLLAAILIFLGWIFFSIFTALVSVTLIGQQLGDLGESVHPIKREKARASAEVEAFEEL